MVKRKEGKKSKDSRIGTNGYRNGKCGMRKDKEKEAKARSPDCRNVRRM